MDKVYRALYEYYDIETLIGLLLLDIEEDMSLEFIKKSSIYNNLYKQIIKENQ